MFAEKTGKKNLCIAYGLRDKKRRVDTAAGLSSLTAKTFNLCAGPAEHYSFAPLSCLPCVASSTCRYERRENTAHRSGNYV